MFATAVQDTVDTATDIANDFNWVVFVAGVILLALGLWLLDKRTIVTTILGPIPLVGAALAFFDLIPEAAQIYIQVIVEIIILISLVILATVLFTRTKGLLSSIAGILVIVGALLVLNHLMSLAPGDSIPGQVYAYLQESTSRIWSTLSGIVDTL